ncbi:MAG: 3-hydroxyacyl-ACP dehydratase FabZ [Defluviitaleaceae bacterium]|nr:3-hydroxyacyl-ACP dehydratase FabZ [Defluviitaleaceae bacterium]
MSQYNHQWIKNKLPHRWPFLHVDRVTKIGKQSIEGYKNVSASESAFVGHFAEISILPGVLIVEALAQLSGMFLLSEEPEGDGAELASKIGLLTSIRSFKFIRIVEPGDQLVLKSILKGSNGDCYIFAVSAYVDGHQVAVGELQLFLQQKEAVV